MDAEMLSGEKEIVIFVNSMRGTHAAGVFRFKISSDSTTGFTLSSDATGFTLSSDAKTGFKVSSDTLKPESVFYQQHNRGFVDTIYTVASCVVGTQLIMFPHDQVRIDTLGPTIDDDWCKLLPRKFDLLTGAEGDMRPTLANKYMPIATAIKDNIFTLSTYKSRFDVIPEPCFEYLDYYNPGGCWKGSPRCPLQINEMRNFALGYVVLEDKFIVVSFEGDILYSYNVVSGKWKSVGFGDKWKLPTIHSRGVVVDHNIYTYCAETMELFVACYIVMTPHEEEFGCDLLLSSERVVQGLVTNDTYDPTYRYYDDFLDYCCTGAIEKIEGKLLCVIHTLYTPFWQELAQPVCVTIIRLVNRDRCITLSCFTFRLMTGKELDDPTIKSCHVLDVEETSDRRHKNIKQVTDAAGESKQYGK